MSYTFVSTRGPVKRYCGSEASWAYSHVDLGPSVNLLLSSDYVPLSEKRKCHPG